MTRIVLIILIISFTTHVNSQILIDGPDAPDLEVTHNDGVITLLLSDDNPISNNYQQGYLVYDETVDDFWTFEGYMIYQVQVPFPELDFDNPDYFRLVAQSDIENDIDLLMNWEYDEGIENCIPVLQVDGENQGLQFEVQLIEDVFALGNSDFQDGGIYCYMAVAYATNPNGNNGECEQPTTFLVSNSAAIGALVVQCTSVSLGITEIEKSEVYLWSNSGKLFLESSSSLDGELLVYSSDGRLINKEILTSELNQEWDVSDLEAGMYIAHVSDGVSVISKRFIVE